MSFYVSKEELEGLEEVFGKINLQRNYLLSKEKKIFSKIKIKTDESKINYYKLQNLEKLEKEYDYLYKLFEILSDDCKSFYNGKVSVLMPEVYNECLSYYQSCRDIIGYLLNNNLDLEEDLSLEIKTIDNFIKILRNINLDGYLEVDERPSLKEYLSIKDFKSKEEIFIEALDKQFSYTYFKYLMRCYMMVEQESIDYLDMNINMPEDLIVEDSNWIKMYDKRSLLEMQKIIMLRVKDKDYKELESSYKQTLMRINRQILKLN